MGPQFTLPAANRMVGQGDPAADIDEVLTALAAMGAGFNVLNGAYAGGADPTGAASSDAAFAAAIAARPANGGMLVVPPGTYKITSGITWVLGQNEFSGLWLMPGAVINYYGSGDCIRAYGTYNSTASELIASLSIMGQGIIDGSSASAGASGLHIGDLFRVRVDDIWIRHFNGTGSKGLWCDNENYYSEQWKVRAFLQDCTTGAMLDCNGAAKAAGYNSFDRSFFDFGIDQWTATHDGVTLNNGVIILEGGLTISGNFASSATALTSAVLRLTGTDGIGDYSSIQGSLLHIGVEGDTTFANRPYTIYFASPSQPYVIDRCYGSVQFGFFGAAFLSSNCAGQFTNYAGPVNGDPALPSALDSGVTTIADSPTTVTTTATAIVNLTRAMDAYEAYKIKLQIPYASTAASGSVTFSLSVPGGIAVSNLTVSVGTAGTTAGTPTATTALKGNWSGSSALVTALTNVVGTRVLEVEGTIAAAGSGQLQVMVSMAAGSTVTIPAGASLMLQEEQDP